MTLKVEIESLDGVDENLRDLYEESGGQYRLKLEGLEDTGALKRAKEHEKHARKQAEQQLNEIQAQLASQKEHEAKKTGDIEALEKSWQSKLATKENELNTHVEKLNKQINKLLIDNEATKIASELAVEGSASVLIPHLKSRLALVEKDGEFAAAVVDSDGKPSALTIEELKNEIATSQAFAPVIVGSKASGGGASTNKSGSATSHELSSMSRKEKLEYFRNQKR